MPHVFSLSGAVPPPASSDVFPPEAGMRANLGTELRMYSLYAVFSVLSAFLARGEGRKREKKKLCVRVYSRTAQVSGQCVRVIVHDDAPPRV